MRTRNADNRGRPGLVVHDGPGARINRCPRRASVLPGTNPSGVWRREAAPLQRCRSPL